MLVKEERPEYVAIGVKSLTIKVDSDFHTQLKVYASKKGMSIKDYIVKTLKEDMAKDEEK